MPGMATTGLLVLLAALVGWWLGNRAGKASSAPVLEAVRERDRELERLRSERDSLLGAGALQKELARQVAEQKAELEGLQRRNEELATESARMQEQVKAGQTALASERELLADAKKQLKDAFAALAADALKNANEQFLGQASRQFDQKQQAIDELLKPVKETLGKLETQTQQLEVKREGAYRELGQQLLHLSDEQKKLQQAATALSSALRDTRATGKWGEIVLHRVVELAGMTEHCDFTQQHTQDENRPDMIVHLPNGRKIVVDAKTSITSFLDAAETQDEAMRQVKLKEHARNIRAHALGLAKRRYEKAFEDAIDLTVCFIPGDVYYYAALQVDAGLFEEAANEKIIFATPTTLIALLKAAAFGWQQDSSSREAKEILKQAAAVYDRLTTATAHLTGLGSSLNKSVESYDRLIGSLERSVFPAARRMKELGIHGDALPPVEPIDRTARQLQAQDWRAAASPESLTLAASEDMMEK